MQYQNNNMKFLLLLLPLLFGASRASNEEVVDRGSKQKENETPPIFAGLKIQHMLMITVTHGKWKKGIIGYHFEASSKDTIRTTVGKDCAMIHHPGESWRCVTDAECSTREGVAIRQRGDQLKTKFYAFFKPKRSPMTLCAGQGTKISRNPFGPTIFHSGNHAFKIETIQMETYESLTNSELHQAIFSVTKSVGRGGYLIEKQKYRNRLREEEELKRKKGIRLKEEAKKEETNSNESKPLWIMYQGPVTIQTFDSQVDIKELLLLIPMPPKSDGNMNLSLRVVKRISDDKWFFYIIEDPCPTPGDKVVICNAENKPEIVYKRIVNEQTVHTGVELSSWLTEAMLKDSSCFERFTKL